jgi:microcystin-dependent protein
MEDIVFIGTIQLFAFTFAPVGWMSCEGQVLTAQQNQALFSLIGNNYGGTYPSTFALPNLNGASPLPAMKYYIATTGLYPSRY